MSSPWKILHGDCLAEMEWMANESVDSIVTDPPYGLNFMNKHWDYEVPGVDVWRECLRVLKPGGHLLSFFGTRTYHRGVIPIEDAGFEIRDQIGWTYGCLDESTEVATINGVMPYHKTKVGDLVLCYDVAHAEYTYSPILEIVEYDYCDTAYRLIGDSFEQVVSRSHRCIVEHSGSEVFMFAETLQREARVPVLENLHELQIAVRNAHKRASYPQKNMHKSVQSEVHRGKELRSKAYVSATERRDDSLPSLWNEEVGACGLAAQSHNRCLQSSMQRSSPWCGLGKVCPHGPYELETRIGSGTTHSNDRNEQPILERRGDVSQSQRCVCRTSDQVCSLPFAVHSNGTQGRVRDGTSVDCRGHAQPRTDPHGNSSPSQSRCYGQRIVESDAIQDERRAQGIRAWRGHKTALVRVVPFHLKGKVWCLRVSTGAFVAVRNGIAFPTGNSGFPKSHNGPWGGTALKPAWEPIVMARKPIVGTVAQNFERYGVGGLNIDGCRVGDEVLAAQTAGQALLGTFIRHDMVTPERIGRYPANLIHDGSDEVLAAFPQAPGQQADVSHTAPSDKTGRVYGAMKREGDFAEKRNDSGSAARFFKQCEMDDIWRDLNLPQENASTADQTSFQQRTAAVSALVLAVNSVLPEGSRCLNLYLEPSTNATAIELKKIAESVTQAIRTIDARFWRELKPARLSLSLGHADVVVARELTGIMKITTSRWKLNGSVESVTFNITRPNSEHGAKGYESQPANRFIYAAKANKKDREEGCDELDAIHRVNGNKWTDQDYRVSSGERPPSAESGPRRNTHPTVKPTDLMRYLCRLVTPTNGLVLDPFMGSGSTGKAALLEGFRFVGIEREAEYINIAMARLVRAEQEGEL